MKMDWTMETSGTAIVILLFLIILLFTSVNEFINWIKDIKKEKK
jgi:hypothetical protein